MPPAAAGTRQVDAVPGGAGSAAGPRGVRGINAQGQVAAAGPLVSGEPLPDLPPAESTILVGVPTQSSVVNAAEAALPPTTAGLPLGPAVAPVTTDPNTPAVEGTFTIHCYRSACPVWPVIM